MATSYLKHRIFDFLRRFYKLTPNVTDNDQNHVYFDLGSIDSFVLKLTAFKTEADINVFILDLSQRLNYCLSA